MANELNSGDTRIGWMIDGDPSTPERAVALRNTGNSIELEIPTHGMSGWNDPYARWFQGGVHHADDPHQTLHAYAPPSCLAFYDARGTVALVGCRDDTWSLGVNAGFGVVRASGAVLGAERVHYGYVNGVRSEIPALTAWSGLTSARQNRRRDSDGRLQGLTLDLESGDPVQLARSKNLTLRPSWRVFPNEDPGHLVSVDELHLESSLSRPTPLVDHLALHERVRQLVVIAAGCDVGYRGLSVNRRDDPIRTFDGTDRGPKWSHYLTYELPSHVPWSKPPTFMFGLNDIGPAGVAKWLHLRDTFARGLLPLLGLVSSEHQYLESQVVLAGIALEAIGYELENATGGHQFNRAGNLAFPVALGLVLRDIGWQAVRNQDDWASAMVSAYKGVKHADRPSPELVELHGVVQAAKIVLRTWVASRVGCKSDSVLRRLRADSRVRSIAPRPER